MDIAENGINAGATLITISIEEMREKNVLTITVRDNGRGMNGERLLKATDPFFTSRTTRRVGLGLSLFKEACLRCAGRFGIESKEDEGTEVTASFQLDHIDLAPLGDMGSSMSTLIVGNPDVDFVYSHYSREKRFVLDTRDIKNELDGVPITHPEVIKYISESIREVHDH
jgi:hypothetical protein